MKNLTKLVEECEKELRSIGIEPRKVIKWSVNYRAKKRWGQCKRIEEGMYEINISYRLMENNVDNQAVKNIIAHELLHTVAHCFGHRGKWQQLANRVNAKLPQYNIARAVKCEDMGVPATQNEPYKYVIRCTTCGNSFRRKRYSSVVKNIHKYHCAKCGGKLEVHEL